MDDDLAVEIGLGAEVVVDQRGVDTGLSGDVPDRRVVEAVLGEVPGRGLEDSRGRIVGCHVLNRV